MYSRTSKQPGLAPGSLVYTGEATTGPVRVSLIAYDENDIEVRDPLSIDDALAHENPAHIDWINVNGLHEVEVVEKVGAHFSLHPLTLEDIVSTGQRPKVEFFDSYVYIVLRMLSLDAENDLRNEQVSLILGPGYVLSFQERDDGDVFDPVRERIEKSKGKIRRQGADYLAYALMDMVVDTHFLILERYGEIIEDLEEEVIDAPTPALLGRINGYRREMIFLRKSVWPLREVLSALYREENSLFTPAVLAYLRDVYDHTVQVIDTVETYRDLLTSLLEVYLSSVSNRMNEVMKVLTIIATIFIPLTFIVGVYGMNFATMPELGWRWGYATVWGVMILVTVGLIAYFRRKGWF